MLAVFHKPRQRPHLVPVLLWGNVLGSGVVSVAMGQHACLRTQNSRVCGHFSYCSTSLVSTNDNRLLCLILNFSLLSHCVSTSVTQTEFPCQQQQRSMRRPRGNLSAVPANMKAACYYCFPARQDSDFSETISSYFHSCLGHGVSSQQKEGC